MDVIKSTIRARCVENIRYRVRNPSIPTFISSDGDEVIRVGHCPFDQIGYAIASLIWRPVGANSSSFEFPTTGLLWSISNYPSIINNFHGCTVADDQTDPVAHGVSEGEVTPALSGTSSCAHRKVVNVGKRGLLAVAEEPPQRQAPEGSPKVNTVEGVDERIDGTVDPTEPGKELAQLRHGPVLRQERRDDVVDEERQPAGNETPDDDAERLGRLVLALHRRDAGREGLLVDADVVATGPSAHQLYRAAGRGRDGRVDRVVPSKTTRCRQRSRRPSLMMMVMVMMVVMMMMVEMLLRRRSATRATTSSSSCSSGARIALGATTTGPIGIGDWIIDNGVKARPIRRLLMAFRCRPIARPRMDCGFVLRGTTTTTSRTHVHQFVRPVLVVVPLGARFQWAGVVQHRSQLCHVRGSGSGQLRRGTLLLRTQWDRFQLGLIAIFLGFPNAVTFLQMQR
uniref:Uncharacterized protein n=1 Tax=Anopheles minimus TaxID=112268 RepID=A0A182VX04_9DIPT